MRRTKIQNDTQAETHNHPKQSKCKETKHEHKRFQNEKTKMTINLTQRETKASKLLNKYENKTYKNLKTDTKYDDK